LEDCLRQFTVSEQVENYSCSHCWHIAAIKYLSLRGATEVILSLKWSVYPQLLMASLLEKRNRFVHVQQTPFMHLSLLLHTLNSSFFFFFSFGFFALPLLSMLVWYGLFNFSDLLLGRYWVLYMYYLMVIHDFVLQTEIKRLKSCNEQDSCTCHLLVHLENLPWSNNFSRTLKQLSIARSPKVWSFDSKLLICYNRLQSV
jgi:hypothetical protein